MQGFGKLERGTTCPHTTVDSNTSVTPACSLQLEVDIWRLNFLWEKIWFLALEINFTCTDSKCGKQKCLL